MTSCALPSGPKTFEIVHFFSASGSKLPPYILPIFPALALLAARSLTRPVLIVQSLITIPVALVVGAVLGALVGTVLMLLRRQGRKEPMPFGPFLAIGALLAMVWGEPILTWYFPGVHG